MNVSDVSQALEYRSTTAVVRLLPTGLLLIFLALVIHALVDLEREPRTAVGIVLCLVVGIALVGFTLWRRANPGKPLFTLAPDGIHYRVPMVKEVLIPWHVIQGVDTVDVEAGYWSSLWVTQTPVLRYNTMVLHDVTVVRLPKSFYDQRIHVATPLLRGPGWNANFIPKGAMIQMALHHELVSVEPRALREAVEARWLAFRERPVDKAARTSVPSAGPGGMTPRRPVKAVPTSGVIAMGENPRAMSAWEATKVAILLIGIAIASAHLAGFWQLPGQAEANEARVKAREQRKYWEDTATKRREESKKLEAEDKARREEFERDMRRVFGR
jgi:hypothetical protein